MSNEYRYATKQKRPHIQTTTLSAEHRWSVYVEEFSGLKEIQCDADGLYNGLIMPPEQYWILWRCSVVALGTATFAWIRKKYDYAFITYCVAFTSLNYWRLPMYCWRHTVDMTVVFIGLCYHISTAIYSECATLYFAIVAIGICAYGLSVYTHKKSSWLSTFFHMVVHICANSSNCVLYMSNNTSEMKTFESDSETIHECQSQKDMIVT